MYTPPDRSFLTPNRAYADVRYYEAAISPEDCETIVNACRGLPAQQGTLKAGAAQQVDAGHRRSAVRWVQYSAGVQSLYDAVRDLARRANDETYHFDITGFTEPLQFTEYTAGGDHYGWHADNAAGIYSLRKLSVILQLSASDDYVGGNVELFLEGKPMAAPRGIGTAIFFPSWLPHCVTPVTEGIRHSLVAWLSGPPFR